MGAGLCWKAPEKTKHRSVMRATTAPRGFKDIISVLAVICSVLLTRTTLTTLLMRTWCKWLCTEVECDTLCRNAYHAQHLQQAEVDCGEAELIQQPQYAAQDDNDQIENVPQV